MPCRHDHDHRTTSILKLSPSGKRLAFAQTEKGETTLKIGDLDGSNPKVCAASSSYYRPLAFSFDERLLLALSSQDNDHQILLCNSAGGMLRSWATTTVRERLQERLTQPFHGRPSWMLDTASFSTDGRQILSVRTDGQLVLWDLNGTRLEGINPQGIFARVIRSPRCLRRRRFGFYLQPHDDRSARPDAADRFDPLSRTKAS